MYSQQQMKLFAGTANVPLAQAIATELNQPLERTEIGRFSDGEIHVELKDNVRGCKAFIIQPTCAPANDTLMEMILMADALHRSSAEKIIAVVPYYGYARQDRRPGYLRVPISARVIADLIQAVRIDHLITIDLHTNQTQGFFGIPVDNLSSTRVFVEDIKTRILGQKKNIVVVSPDVGGVARARTLASHLDNCDLAIIDKRRPRANVSEVVNIIGDVEGRTCIICDDMVDTSSTLCKGAHALMEIGGAKEVIAYCTHPVLSGRANEIIAESKLSQLVITDTIPLTETTRDNPKIKQITVAKVLAETIKRVDNGKSISELLN